MEFDFQQQPGLTLLERNLVRDGEPLVSIITPYYNGGKYFEQTFNCVMNQTFPWFEWIIVDDGSTKQDDLAVLERFAVKDPRIHVFHKENGGAASSRNYGIEKAITEFVLPLDCDDLIEPTYLEVCWWMLLKNPSATWAYTDSVGFQNEEYLWKVFFNPETEKTENLLPATALIRKTAIQSIGGYEIHGKYYHEDWLAWLRLLEEGGYPVQAKQDFLFWYRRTDNGNLAKADRDENIAKKNKLLIDEAAKKIVNPHLPVIYPKAFSTCYDVPQMSKWNKTIFADHSKVHVAFVVPWMVMGGADKFNLDLIAGLDRSRFDVGVLTTLASENPWVQKFRAVCADVFNLPNFVEPTDFAAFISYYIKSRDLDVLVVSNSNIGYSLTPWLRENFPALAIVDYVHMEEWYYRKGGFARESGVIAGALDRTYVCNSATRDVMLTAFGRQPESVETVHIGVDEKRFDRSLIAPGTLYQECGLEPTRPVVLFICRLHPQKRPFLMLQIAERVKKAVPEVAFVVVGDGELENEMKARTAKMSLQHHVFFLGSKSDVRPYYRDARVTLVCSLKEGLSLTAYESCSMGVPIVSADVGGQRDLVDADVGALVPCLQNEATGIQDTQYTEEEVMSYVQPLVQILTDDDLWQKMSANARHKIENGFTIQNMVDYFENEFTRLVTDPQEIECRQKKSDALAILSPLAAEYYTMYTQAESLELHINWINSRQGVSVFAPAGGQSVWNRLRELARKTRKALKEKGLKATLKTIWHKLFA